MIIQLILIIVFIVGFIAIGVTWNNNRSNFLPIKTKMHFLHIAKNGGSSIRSIGKKSKKFSYTGHDYTADHGDKHFFAVIRDPIDRFVSAFNFAKRGGFTPNIPSFLEHDIRYYDSINHYLNNIRNNDETALRTLFTSEPGDIHDNASVIYWPQVHWLRSHSNKRLTLMDFNNLNDHFRKKFDIELPNSNKTDHKKFTEISPENIAFLRKIYSPDFKLYEIVRNKGTFETDTDFIKTLGTPDKLVTPENFI